MTHRKATRHPRPTDTGAHVPARKIPRPAPESRAGKLELVLKCDSMGSVEAVLSSIAGLHPGNIEISVIHAAVGPVSKSDLNMARTGSLLVIGFDVDVLPHIQHLAQEHGVEVRLYDVIYKLLDDLKQMAVTLIPPAVEEKITGRAKVIALFKSSRRGIIIGCEVIEGALTVGDQFRIIAAMGPVYTGRIESMQIERAAVKEAKVKQQAGIKITDFNMVKIGDLVECFTSLRPKGIIPWRPKPGVFRLQSQTQ